MTHALANKDILTNLLPFLNFESKKDLRLLDKKTKAAGDALNLKFQLRYQFIYEYALLPYWEQTDKTKGRAKPLSVNEIKDTSRFADLCKNSSFDYSWIETRRVTRTHFETFQKKGRLIIGRDNIKGRHELSLKWPFSLLNSLIERKVKDIETTDFDTWRTTDGSRGRFVKIALKSVPSA